MTVLAPPGRRSARRRMDAGERWDALNRIPADLWTALLEDHETRERFDSKIYRRGPGKCAYWLGSLSSSGHGRFRAGTRGTDAGRPGSLVVVSHIYAYMLSRGLPHADPVTGRLPVIRHRCDEASCTAGVHLTAGTPAENAQEYVARHLDPFSPLADRRGPRGRAVAIRDAILTAQAEGASVGAIEAVIWSASAAGIPGAQEALF